MGEQSNRMTTAVLYIWSERGNLLEKIVVLVLGLMSKFCRSVERREVLRGLLQDMELPS